MRVLQTAAVIASIGLTALFSQAAWAQLCTVTAAAASYTIPATLHYDGTQTSNFIGVGTSDYLFEDGWWFRVAGDTQESFFPVPTTTNCAGAAGTITWTDVSTRGLFSATNTLALTSAAAGSGQLVLTMSITNLSAVNPLTISLFHGADFDVNGSTNNATLLNPNDRIRIINTGGEFAEYGGLNPSANAFLVRPFSTTTDVFGVLGNAAVDNFDNTALPAFGNDFTGAFQWNLVIPPSGTSSVTAVLTGNSALPVAQLAPVAAVADTTLTAGTGSVTPTITTPAQGSGSTNFACSILPTAPSNFTITRNAGQTITTTTAAIGLTCAPQAAATTATLTCTQTATPGPNPANATALITCPAVAAAPTLTYNPLTTAGVTFPGGPAGVDNATIAISSMGAVGVGQSAVTGCAITGPGAAAFGAVTTTPAGGIFNTGTTSGSINLSCTRGASAAMASLACTETATPTVAGSPFTRTWALTCPAITPVAPVAAVAATTLTAGAGSVTPSITTPAQGAGSTLFGCSIPATAPSNFAITSNASQTITTTPVAIGLTCVPQIAATTATLTCTQTATPGPNPANATALITCPAAAPASCALSNTLTVTDPVFNRTTAFAQGGTCNLSGAGTACLLYTSDAADE